MRKRSRRDARRVWRSRRAAAPSATQQAARRPRRPGRPGSAGTIAPPTRTRPRPTIRLHRAAAGRQPPLRAAGRLGRVLPQPLQAPRCSPARSASSSTTRFAEDPHDLNARPPRRHRRYAFATLGAGEIAGEDARPQPPAPGSCAARCPSTRRAGMRRRYVTVADACSDRRRRLACAAVHAGPHAPRVARRPPPARLAAGGRRGRPRPSPATPSSPPRRPRPARRRSACTSRTGCSPRAGSARVARRRADHAHLPPVGGRRRPLRHRPRAQPAQRRRARAARPPRRRRDLRRRSPPARACTAAAARRCRRC